MTTTRRGLTTTMLRPIRDAGGGAPVNWTGHTRFNSMTRFGCDTERRDGEDLYVLRDSATGASATIWPAFGNNCLAARLPAPDGRLIDLILGPVSLEDVRRQP
jgi:hypothetical protein